MANFTYTFVAGTTWVVPPNVTGIQVECFGSNFNSVGGGRVTSGSPPQANYPGASYSKSSNITVTAGATVYINIGSNGGNTWFNTVNATPTSASSPTSACLAVGTNTAAGSQVAANCGDVKYAGGNGRVTTGFTLTAQGGKAGPNGPGADVGDPFTNTARLLDDGNSYLFCQGGGSNGGSQGSLGVPAYGRSGSGTAGMGGRWSGASNVLSTRDTLGSATYFNNLPLLKDSSDNNYGLFGGGATEIYYDCCNYQYWTIFGGNNSDKISYNGYNGYIVITITVASQKSIVFPAIGGGSFTIPNDFGSLVSIEAVGFPATGGNGGAAPNGGGGGGAAYAKTLGSSVTASMVAGSTLVYFGSVGSINPPDSWLRIGTNSAPSSVTDGVLAKGGSYGSGSTGGAGGLAASSVGDTKYSGGTGGAGYTTNVYNQGGGGGAGGPLGAGATGGNGSVSGTNRGGGGGGAANGGAAGSVGTTSAGGAGGTITGGTGGAGATVAGNPGGRGTNGGGGGGSYGVFGGYSDSDLSGLLNNSIYPLSGGQGGATGQFGAVNGRPGGGGASVYIAPSTYFNNPSNPDDPNTYVASGVVVFTYITSNNVTAALTGRSASASSGTLTTSQTLTQALSSGSASALAGTLTASQTLTIALSSAIAEAFGGAFVPSNDQVVNLSSVLASASGGTLTNLQLITQALTGVSADGRTSSFPVFLELVGASAAGATGLFGYVNTGWQPINTAGGSTSWVDVNTQQE